MSERLRETVSDWFEDNMLLAFDGFVFDVMPDLVRNQDEGSTQFLLALREVIKVIDDEMQEQPESEVTNSPTADYTYTKA